MHRIKFMALALLILLLALLFNQRFLEEVQSDLRHLLGNVTDTFPIGYFDYPILGIHGLTLESSSIESNPNESKSAIGYGKELSTDQRSSIDGNLVGFSSDSDAKVSLGGTIKGTFVFGKQLVIPAAKSPQGKVIPVTADRFGSIPSIPEGCIFGIERITAKANQTLGLRDGNYQIQSLRMEPNSTILFSPRSTNIFINNPAASQNTILIEADQCTLHAVGGSGFLKVWCSSKGIIRIRNKTSFNGAIYAPYAAVEIGPDVRYEGAIVADTIKIKGNSRVKCISRIR